MINFTAFSAEFEKIAGIGAGIRAVVRRRAGPSAKVVSAKMPMPGRVREFSERLQSAQDASPVVRLYRRASGAVRRLRGRLGGGS